MKKTRLLQVDLLVDTDGPVADFYRYKSGSTKLTRKSYRVHFMASASAKAHFINRVYALQLALCKAA